MLAYHRPVHLPLDTTAKQCFTCGIQAETVRLCANCGEAVYCSKNCQRQDWQDHRLRCGQTVKLDMNIFYPFLALMTEAGRWMNLEGNPRHPALARPIHDVSPLPVRLPDQTEAILVTYDGSQKPRKMQGEYSWWPSTPSQEETFRLFVRISQDARSTLLPITTGICLAMLREMYTTTSGIGLEPWGSKPQQRVRLKYNSSPIADFGIAKGPVTVQPFKRLAYYDTSTRTFSHGQDPDNHYWFYFETGKGEILYVDCGLGTFGFWYSADVEPYNKFFEPQEDPGPRFKYVPAHLSDKTCAKLDSKLHKTVKRSSVLRNEGLQRATENTRLGDKEGIVDVVKDFLTELKGVECSRDEAVLTTKYAEQYYTCFHRMLYNESWNEWPRRVEGCAWRHDPLVPGTRSGDDYLKKWLTVRVPSLDVDDFVAS